MARSRKFCEEISKKCEYIAPHIVRHVYYAMLRVFLDEIREKRKFNFPDFGRFRIGNHKGGKRYYYKIRQHYVAKPYNQLRFSPSFKLKMYVKHKIKKIGELKKEEKKTV